MVLAEPSSIYTAATVAHWFFGFIVVAEGLNKLERSAPLARGLSARQRFVALLKVLAWVLLVLGAGGAVIRPLVVTGIGVNVQAWPVLLTDRVSLVDLCVLGGFAVLIIRSRFKEG